MLRKIQIFQNCRQKNKAKNNAKILLTFLVFSLPLFAAGRRCRICVATNVGAQLGEPGDSREGSADDVLHGGRTDQCAACADGVL